MYQCRLDLVSVCLCPQIGFFEVWLTRVTRLSSPDRIVFDDGTAFTLSQLVIIYDVSILIYHYSI